MKQVKCLSAQALGALLFFAGCGKHDAPAPAKTYSPLDDGLYVLNEGYTANSTTLTYYDSVTQTPVTDIYKNVNDSTLGNAGNDILIYGGKLYVVMTNSSNVTVMNKRTAQTIKQIVAADGSSWQPRNIISYNGSVIVSAWDGTVSVIDTASLSITNTVTVGSNLEGLAVSGNMLYVARSGGLSYPNLDSTVSVINLSTMQATQKITVGLNPQKIAVDSKGNAYVFIWGNYGTVPAKIYKINNSTQTVVDSSAATIASDKMIIYNDVLYLDGSGTQPVVTLNTSNLQGNFTNFVTDGTTLITPYGINIDPNNGNVYVTDAVDYKSSGEVYCFSNAGKLLYSFAAGINPDNVVFLR